MAQAKPSVLLLLGGKFHDFQRGGELITQALQPRFDVTATEDLAALGRLDQGDYQLVAIYTCRRDDEMSDSIAESLEAFVRNGGGLLGIHGANASFTENEKYLKLIGSRFEGHGPMMAFDVEPTSETHPVVARTDAFDVFDELYRSTPTVDDLDVFATAFWQGDRPLMGYQRDLGKGRVLYVAPGHDERSLGNRYVQRMIERAARVAVGETFEKQITAGILGYGGAFNMGRQHGNAINRQPGMSVTSVCDLDPKRTDQAKEELGDQIKTWNDTEAFFAEGEFDLCIQILPHHLHGMMCSEALKAGKHVVTEKPFCITLEEADEMNGLAREHDLMLSCYHNRRWDGDFLVMLKQIREGKIGEVFRIDASLASFGRPGTWWRSSKEISGGVMYDWGAHYCDWTLNLMNKPIASVTGDFQKRRWHHVTNEDYTYALVRFADGSTATLEQGSLAAISRNGFRILGTHGGMTNAGPGQDVTLRAEAPAGLADTLLKPLKIDGANRYYQNVGNHLIMGERLVVTPEQARRVIGVIHLAEQSAKQDGKPLPLPGEEHDEPDYLMPW
jgi:predicted dehydrogenase